MLKSNCRYPTISMANIFTEKNYGGMGIRDGNPAAKVGVNQGLTPEFVLFRGLDDQGDRAVVAQLDFHFGAELSGRDLEVAFLGQSVDEEPV